MIIKFKDRIMEWWLAANTLLFGLFISAPPTSMSSEIFNQLLQHISEKQWAVFFMITGATHLIALIINGRRWWTPILRSITSAANTSVFILFGVGILFSTPTAAGAYIYLVMISSAAAICFYRAVKDASVAIEARKYDPN